MSSPTHREIGEPAGCWAPPSSKVLFLWRGGGPLLAIEVGDQTVGVHLHDSTSWLRVLGAAWERHREAQLDAEDEAGIALAEEIRAQGPGDRMTLDEVLGGEREGGE